METTPCAYQEVIGVGGGNSAGQAAVFLSKHAKHVHMLVRGQQLAQDVAALAIQMRTRRRGALLGLVPGPMRRRLAQRRMYAREWINFATVTVALEEHWRAAGVRPCGRPRLRSANRPAGRVTACFPVTIRFFHPQAVERLRRRWPRILLLPASITQQYLPPMKAQPSS